MFYLDARTDTAILCEYCLCKTCDFTRSYISNSLIIKFTNYQQSWEFSHGHYTLLEWFLLLIFLE